MLLDQPNVMDPKGCRDKAMIELLYATGIRVSELIDLNLQDINLKTGMLHCRRPKSDRIIPIYAEAVASLSDYIHESGESLSIQLVKMDRPCL